MGNLIIKADVIKGHSRLSEDDIHEQWIEDAENEIETRTGVKYYEWEGTLNVDGTDEKWIDLPVDYVAEITAVTEGDYDDDDIATIELTKLHLDGEEARYWIKEDETVASSAQDELKGTVWTDGIKNVHITGTFGKVTPPLVRQLAVFMVLRRVSDIMPNKVNMDLVRTQTARWTEVRQSGRFTFDELIERMFATIPLTPQMRYGTV